MCWGINAAPLASTCQVPVSTLPPRPSATAKVCPVCRLMCLRCKCPHLGSLAFGVDVSSVPVVTLHLNQVDAAPGAAWKSPYSQFCTFWETHGLHTCVSWCSLPCSLLVLVVEEVVLQHWRGPCAEMQSCLPLPPSDSRGRSRVHPTDRFVTLSR